MTQRNVRSGAARIGLALLGLASVVGCKRHAPIGQFDDGTYEIRDARGEVVGELFAHHAANYSDSYEFWAVSERACPKTSPTCALGGANFRFKQSFKNVADWRSYWDRTHAGSQGSFRYFRATYDNSMAGALTCSSSACSFSASGRATAFAMFPAGTYRASGSDGAYVVVAKVGAGVAETWFMDRFFNESMPDAGVTLSSLGSAIGAEVAKACNDASVKVDVRYRECEVMPAGEGDCSK